MKRWYEKQGRGFLSDARKTRGATNGSDAIQLDIEMSTGGVLSTLIDMSKEADMVVVGCRGLGVIGRRLLGSISWGLVRHAHCLHREWHNRWMSRIHPGGAALVCPVVVVYDEDPLMLYPIAQASVVVGIGGSPASESATAIAFDEASRCGVELVAVHAWSDHAAYELPGLKWSELEEQAKEVLAGWQERYPDLSVRRVVVIDRPAHQLI